LSSDARDEPSNSNSGVQNSWQDLINQALCLPNQTQWNATLALASLLSPATEPAELLRPIPQQPNSQTTSSAACHGVPPLSGAQSWPTSLNLRTPSPDGSRFLLSPRANSVTTPYSLPRPASTGDLLTSLSLWSNSEDEANKDKKHTRILSDRRRETNREASRRSRARKRLQYETLSNQLAQFRVSWTFVVMLIRRRMPCFKFVRSSRRPANPLIGHLTATIPHPTKLCETS
jgi:hypothetical protein